MAQQLVLDLGHRPALGRDDFLVTPANEMAVNLVDRWPNWPSYGAVLAGPRGAGKTHLADVWRQASGATMFAAKDLETEKALEISNTGSVLLEDIDSGTVSPVALFHLLNQVRQMQGHVLLTTSTWPLAHVTLPDLATRLRALPVAYILPPDDALLRGVLVKQFADRQIVVDEALISYLVMRMPRSLDVARRLVARIDEAAFEQGAEVTRVFASRILASFQDTDLS